MTYDQVIAKLAELSAQCVTKPDNEFAKMAAKLREEIPRMHVFIHAAAEVVQASVPEALEQMPFRGVMRWLEEKDAAPGRVDVRLDALLSSREQDAEAEEAIRVANEEAKQQ